MDEKLKSAIDYGLKRNEFSGLKPNQSEIIEAYLKGHHKFEFWKGISQIRFLYHSTDK